MSDLFDTLPVQVSLDRQIACVERELRYRRRVYQRFVAEGKMGAAKASEEISCMEAVLATLRTIKERNS